MITPGSANPLFLKTNGVYNLTRSLRFRSSASAYLNRTPAGAGNRRTWTYSTWVKLGSLSTALNLLYAYSADTDSGLCQLSYQSNQLRIQGITASFLMVSTAVYRDPSAWYHVVYSVDTTQATAANRVRVYVNGVEITAWSTNAPPPQNTDTAINNNVAHNIGRNTRNSNDYFDGYMTEINLIDGQALTPSSFGAYSPYNQWLPKKYAGTYGTNGFYLPFTNNASTITLGYDFSPNGNNWTTNNISVTSGSTYDSMTDVPTLTSATAANFCVLNPLNNPSTYVTYSQGNLTAINTASASHACFNSSMGMATNSGKYYWEVITTGDGNTRNGTGIGTAASVTSASNVWGGVSGQAGLYIGGSSSVYFENQGTLSVFSAAWASGNVMMYAYDATTGNFWAGQNGVWYTSTGGTTANPATATSPTLTLSNASTWFAGGTVFNQGVSSYLYFNFGQQPWSYTPPSGFVALNTFNL